MSASWILSGDGLFALTGALLIGIGLYGLIVQAHLIRKIVAFNVTGGGVFLLFGAIADRSVPGLASDPVPQAMIITAIVVALAATALAAALVLRLFLATGQTRLPSEPPGPEN